MPLPVITLKKLHHRGGDQIGLYFEYNATLIAHIKKLEGIKWSATNKCWYIEDTPENLSKIFQNQRQHAQIRNQTGQEYEVKDSRSRFEKLDENQQELLKEFKSFLQGKRYSKSTVNTYTTFIASFVYYVQKPLSLIETRDIQKYCEDEMAAKKYSISTHRQFVGAMKQFKELHASASFEVPDSLRPHKSRFLPIVLSQEEVIDLLRATKNLKHRTILAIIYSGGLRIGELLRLKLSDIDIDRRHILVRQAKGRKDRYVVLAESVLPMLENYLSTYQPGKFLIEGQAGGQYSPESIRSFLKRACKSANINKHVTPHTLRHSYATHLLESGIDLRYIQELLGHQSPRTTMVYTHVTRKSLMQVRSPLDDAVKKLMLDDKSNTLLPISRNI